MADTKSPGTAAPLPSAESLRMAMLEKQMAELDKAEKAREREKNELSAFADAFLKDHVNDEERAAVRRLVARAVADGKVEALVYSFPSDLCTDGGRAINNGAPDWPETLQGKAREMYDAYKARFQPQGYRLKAMIVTFPGGIPGDVGFFLNWAPSTV